MPHKEIILKLILLVLSIVHVGMFAFYSTGVLWALLTGYNRHLNVNEVNVSWL